MRDRPHKDKEFLPVADIPCRVAAILDEIQSSLLERATAFREEHFRRLDTKEEFYAFFTPANSGKPEVHGGFALTHWNGSATVEEQVKNDLKVTIRCIPFEHSPEAGICPFSGEPSKQRVIWAKSY